MEIRFPAKSPFDDEQEYFEVLLDGAWHRLALDDYASIYAVPGLYEALMKHCLGCRSATRVVDLLATVLEDWSDAARTLRILELGSGNGIVAECLRSRGMGTIVGLDGLVQGKQAADRDRPGVYVDYLVGDIMAFAGDWLNKLCAARFNCLVTVARLGSHDICPRVFRRAFDLVEDGGWLAFTTVEPRPGDTDASTGLRYLTNLMVSRGAVRLEAYHRYCHRKSVAGTNLFLTAFIGRKVRSLGDNELPSESDANSPLLLDNFPPGHAVEMGASRTVTIGNIIVDLFTETVSANGRLISLTKHQRRILKRLSLTPGAVVSPEELCNFAEIQMALNHENLQNEIWRLRRRLGP
ncbi:MAG TPA: methyltransferase domain-containing protein, partial [Polyangiaceae bacterium]